MADVFISYSSNDSQMGNWMGEGCANYGLTYFLSEKSLKHGSDWKRQIIQEIKDATTFIFLATDNSILSDACKHEIGMALAEDVSIIPILYGVDFSDLPDWIADFHGVKVQDDCIDDLQRCLDGLRKQKQRSQRNTLLAIAGVVLGLFLFSNDSG